MIGQENILDSLQKKLNRSLLLVGEPGSGKTTLANHLAHKNNLQFVNVEDLSVDSIKGIIEDSVFNTYPSLFCFENVESMSEVSQNTLLKTLEDGSNDDIFVFCVNDKTQAIDTIQSRSVTYTMEKYSKEELIKYSETRCDGIDISYCKTPGDIEYKKYLIDAGVYDSVMGLVKNIYTKIDKANVGNIFNINHRLEVYDFDKRMSLWIINVLLEHFKHSYMKVKFCLNFKYHIMRNNTDFKRSFEQLLVRLNE